ncbi:hypothetical protein FD755_011994 [Muntiacus reevesi]|uniref:Sushi domain-containing protein n=1 Tax=Muntiacus reevesi TaxID=9886 RepID=A0A5N3XUE6_MUNRE|nr:hypothetical protein FD755_011994 [Muntiacus reevesi]
MLIHVFCYLHLLKKIVVYKVRISSLSLRYPYTYLLSLISSCSSPPEIKHGRFTYIEKGILRTNVVDYECEEGYTLVGEARISCTFLNWSPMVPECKALCQKPEISNGKLSVEKAQYVTPETVTVRCDPGYRMVGSQNIFCSENKSWSPDVPKCEKVSNTQ